MADVALGPTLDRLGVTADLDPDDLVCSAVVIMAVLVPGETNTRLTISNSDGMTWIEQTGLLRLAERITSEPPEIP